jgi:hypothetical protein
LSHFALDFKNGPKNAQAPYLLAYAILPSVFKMALKCSSLVFINSPKNAQAPYLLVYAILPSIFKIALKRSSPVFIGLRL